MRMAWVLFWAAALQPIAAGQNLSMPAPDSRAFAPPASLAPVPESASTTSTGPNETSDESVATFRKRIDEVDVVFSVTNHHGRLINGLKKSQFTILDDHQPPRAVVSFSSHTDLALRVGLLIDASGSVADRFGLEQQAASQFLSEIIRPKSDQAFVMGFDSSPELTQDFTGSTTQLEHGIRALRPGGGTAIYDAIYYACRDKLTNASANTPIRRAIVVLSDGEDNQSRYTLAQAVEMAQRAEVIIYAISTNYSNIKMRGDYALEQLAEATGGRAYLPMKIKDVSNAFTQIRDELRSQYALAYRPAELQEDGRYHSIQILVDNAKYKVHARKGYYAPVQ